MEQMCVSLGTGGWPLTLQRSSGHPTEYHKSHLTLMVLNVYINNLRAVKNFHGDAREIT